MKGRREPERRARRRASGRGAREAVMAGSGGGAAAVVRGTVESPEAGWYGGGFATSEGEGRSQAVKMVDGRTFCLLDSIVKTL